MIVKTTCSPRVFWTVILIVLCELFAVVGVVVLFFMTSAKAHQAPTGWIYPSECCSGIDCREVSDTAVLEGPEGYRIKATGEVIPMTSRKVRNSPDGHFHWCSLGGRDDGRTICLFVPPRGY